MSEAVDIAPATGRLGVLLPGLGASQLVERRRGSVRFGDFPFRIMRGEHLECQSVPAAGPRVGVPRAAPGPVVHCS